MSNAALVQVLDRRAGVPVTDPDSSLLTRFLTERDEEAFATLVRHHGPLVYGTCQRVLGNRAEADDAFQAVFFVLARRAPALKLDRGIGPWLHGVALRVAKKLRGQIVQRRLREMSAAKPERVDPAEPQHDFWAVIDEELARMPLPLREAVLLCDLGGWSHARAAESLGLAKGTITKRLAKAHEELAARLNRRGVTLGAGALAALIATRATASVPAPLVSETARHAVAFSLGQVHGSVTAKTLAESVMRSLKVGALKRYALAGLVAVALAVAGGSLIRAGGSADPDDKPAARPKAAAPPDAVKAGTIWKENFTVDYPGSLPVSVEFSADGKILLTGDTNGEVMPLIFTGDDPQWLWKAKVGGSHAAVAFSAGQQRVYAAFTDGIKVLNAKDGKIIESIEQKGSSPLNIGVFPDVQILNDVPRFSTSKIVFGNAHGYIIKTWAEGKLTDTVGTIETTTAAKDAKPDPSAVPLAVDPKGRSAIMTGPRDAKGKNVLWAYVCGDQSKGSPGNRILEGHAAPVVSAAWAKDGGTAVTGDADGRVIVWDAKSMKETGRVELGGRVAALAVSSDAKFTAAYVLGKQGELFAWEGTKPLRGMKPIHTDLSDFRAAESYASLTFSPDGKRLAGCAINKAWLNRLGELSGKVRVWELAAEPKAQLVPKHLYTKQLPKGSSANFVVLYNNTLLMPAAKEGAIDLIRVTDGGIQSRLGLGNFSIGKMLLSADQNWLAMEQYAPVDPKLAPPPARTCDVSVRDMRTWKHQTILSCEALLNVASGGKVVAVVREKKIELWDSVTSKLLKTAPFKHTRIDATQFSPDGKLLAISDRNELVLWRWEDEKHERIDLGRCVGALTFSPDGKFLAEGPAPHENIQIRDLDTRKVVQKLDNGTKRSMNVPQMVYTQSGRVLIGCDNITFAKEIAVPHRINLWDTTTGAIAHQLALPAGLPSRIEVTPNGRHLVATLDEGDSGIKLSVWRLDGEVPMREPGANGPAATPPR
ncbi:sigma-70 family RNA polymerase sigma factor [Gemmata sp. G18]|uniref:Sigma-70 family RNA polymerase sigma factor n=1 Tax=Gemmata palustris TaxID=2822762 RepID=A0ABS5C3U0_9BACT|nr:sigma-70 family RNA polymerase sigma factor [Gemmata palustris]MBP3960558.1 sigma-70 family RNA polymerase sigma factor [Gemmata palustris]